MLFCTFKMLIYQAKWSSGDSGGLSTVCFEKTNKQAWDFICSHYCKKRMLDSTVEWRVWQSEVEQQKGWPKCSELILLLLLFFSENPCSECHMDLAPEAEFVVFMQVVFILGHEKDDSFFSERLRRRLQQGSGQPTSRTCILNLTIPSEWISNGTIFSSGQMTKLNCKPCKDQDDWYALDHWILHSCAFTWTFVTEKKKRWKQQRIPTIGLTT